MEENLFYVTPRIVCAQLSLEQSQQELKKRIDKIYKFLDTQHDESNYNLFNLNEKFKTKKQHLSLFSGLHFSHQMHQLVEVCKYIDNWLSLKVANVVVFLGSVEMKKYIVIICCYLIYSGRFPDPDDAIKYFSEKMLQKTQISTSQIRQIHFFNQQLINQQLVDFKYLSHIDLVGMPSFEKNSCRPFLQVLQFNQENNEYQTIYEDQINSRQLFTDKGVNELNSINLQLQEPTVVYDDFKIRIFHSTKDEYTKMLEYDLNTAYIQEQYNLDLNQIEIEDLERFQINFKISNAFTEIKDIKNKKSEQLRINESLVRSILKERFIHNIQESQIFLFGREKFDDVDQVLNGKEGVKLYPYGYPIDQLKVVF